MAGKPTRATINLVWNRDQSRCFICCRLLLYGNGGYSIHHRRPRGMGGSKDPVTNSPANLLLLCGSGTSGCHDRIERGRLEARSNGWLVPYYDDPRLVPALRWRRSLVWLTETGGLVALDSSAVRATREDT